MTKGRHGLDEVEEFVDGRGTHLILRSTPSPTTPTPADVRERIREVLTRVGVTEGTVGIATHRALVEDLGRVALAPPTETP